MPKKYPAEVRKRAVRMTLDRHSDAGSQQTSDYFTATVAFEGLIAAIGTIGSIGTIGTIGTIGEVYDNVAAETVMELYKNEAVAKNSLFMTGPLETLADLERLTVDWLD
jgi:putative transposase